MKRLAISVVAFAALVLVSLAQNTHTYGGRIIEGGVNVLGTASGTDTYTVTPSPALVAYSSTVSYLVKFTNANTTAATLNVSSLGAIGIKKQASAALVSGDIAAGSVHELKYDGTNLEIDNVDNAPSGSGTVNNCSTLGSLAYYAATGTAASCVGADLTFNTHTLTAAATALLDLSPATGANAFKIPVQAGAAPTADGAVSVNSTTHLPAFGSNGATITPAISIGSGTAAMGTGAITSGACASVVTVASANVATTDVIQYTPNADPTGVTGYAVSASGSLYIWAYPTSGNVNFKVCNNTSGSLTPSALTLNWRVSR